MSSQTLSTHNTTKINYVIFDTDIGSDDAWGLIMLIKAEQELKNFKLLGITCVHGNTTVNNVASNALRVLTALERLDIPIYKGCIEPLISRTYDLAYFHGRDGFGDVYDNSNIVKSQIQNVHAINAMYELVCKYPKQISFILVGPLTNIAICIKMYPDFAENIKNVYIMGGNMKAIGNSSSCAEFNFYADPESASIALNTLSCPIYILPWETCLIDNIHIPIEWRFDVMGSIINKIIDLMNPVDKSCYIKKGYKHWIPCDALLTAAYLFPTIVEQTMNCHATVELNGTHTRGQMVIDHLKHKLENVQIIEKTNIEDFKQILLWTAYHKIDISKIVNSLG